jgi:hypothetical protein
MSKENICEGIDFSRLDNSDADNLRFALSYLGDYVENTGVHGLWVYGSFAHMIETEEPVFFDEVDGEVLEKHPTSIDFDAPKRYNDIDILIERDYRGSNSSKLMSAEARTLCEMLSDLEDDFESYEDPVFALNRRGNLILPSPNGENRTLEYKDSFNGSVLDIIYSTRNPGQTYKDSGEITGLAHKII